MKSFFNKILSLVLAVSIVFATSSFSVDMHFCCNKLVDIAILGKAKVCKEKVQKNLPVPKTCTFQQNDCCSSQSFIKQGDETQKPQTEVETETLIFLNKFYYTYTNLFEGLEENIVPFQKYRPPLLYKDISILYETFLV